jgi:hypothetical protein
MNQNLARLLCLTPILLGFSAHSSAQVTTGLPPFGTFSGGPFDTVNNANLNVHFEIPVVNKAGRGLPSHSYAPYMSFYTCQCAKGEGANPQKAVSFFRSTLNATGG